MPGRIHITSLACASSRIRSRALSVASGVLASSLLPSDITACSTKAGRGEEERAMMSVKNRTEPTPTRARARHSGRWAATPLAMESPRTTQEVAPASEVRPASEWAPPSVAQHSPPKASAQPPRTTRARVGAWTREVGVCPRRSRVSLRRWKAHRASGASEARSAERTGRSRRRPARAEARVWRGGLIPRVGEVPKKTAPLCASVERRGRCVPTCSEILD